MHLQSSLIYRAELKFCFIGQKEEAASPASIIAAAMARRARLQDQLRSVERQAYELETSYLQESVQCGSVLKGFEGYLSSTKSTTNLKRSKRVRLKDRLFSLSSVTSPAAEEQHLAARHDGRPATGAGRLRVGALAASEQGNLKKDGRILNRQNLDGEDEFDL